MKQLKCIHPEYIIPLSRKSTEVFKTGEWNHNRPVFKEKLSPCQVACPVGNQIGLALFHASQGRFDESLSVFLQENPLPGVCGRLCYHPCQGDCNRGEFDGAVNIRALERSAADFGNAQPTALTDAGKKQPVAVVGSGPAGLAAAYHLSRMGHPVTLFEAEKQAGGMLRLAIPRHRLPEAALEHDLTRIMSFGIDLQCNVLVDAKKMKGLLTEFQAVFYAGGAHQSRCLDIPGADEGQVMSGLHFLKSVRDGQIKELPGRMVVIGGGNVAIDVAMTARRLGVEYVNVVSLEQRNDLPAHERDLWEAEQENITFYHGWGPQKIGTKNNRVSDVKFIGCTSVFDGNQRFAPGFDEKKTLVLETDWVISAIGQKPDPGIINSEIFNMSAADRLQNGMASPVKGLYVGGDVTGLQGSVAAAIGAGKRAALNIHLDLNPATYDEDVLKAAFIDGSGFSIDAVFNPRPHWDSKVVVRFESIDPLYLQSRKASVVPCLNPAERVKSFDEINQGLNASVALVEAARCFFCGTCVGCEHCLLYCPDLSIHSSDGKTFMYKPDDQYCKGCGTCAAVCNRGVMKFGEES